MTGTDKKVLLLTFVFFAVISARAEIQVQIQPDNDPDIVSTISASFASGSTPTNPPGNTAVFVGNEGNDILQFINRDKLHGTLISLDPATYGLRWRHANAEKAIDFSLANMTEARLGARKTADHKPDTAAILLSNDDLLRGKIVSMDNDKLVLDTWYAGKLAVKRTMLKKILTGTKSSVVYEGPVSLAEWTVGRHGNQNAWRFKDGALYEDMEASIARNIENMPAMADMQFDAAWRGGYPGFSFYFFNDNAMQQANCYMLQISGGTAYLNRYERNSGSQSLGNAEVRRFANGRSTSARFNILTDKTKKTIVLLIDGQIIRQWVDSNSFAGRGNAIMFYPQQQTGLKISNIRIAEWDGAIPQSVSGSDTQETKDDLVKLVNGDKVSGHLKSITGENAKFETTYAAMDIPLEKMSEIAMATAGMERARRNKDDVRAVFFGKGAVTIRLVRMDKNTLTGSTENFGEVNMPLEAFSALQFNIYREQPAETDDDYSSF
jgi:hypothetical protein